VVTRCVGGEEVGRVGKYGRDLSQKLPEGLHFLPGRRESRRILLCGHTNDETSMT
jgi:hypothetical protein